jgi:methyl-accepting chemotaxis protein
MKLRTQLFLGYFLIFFFIIVIALVTYQVINSLISTSQWVTDIQTEITEAHKTEKLLVEMETGLRGFLLTDEEEFLEPFKTGIKVFKTTLDSLKMNVSDKPSQVKLLVYYEAGVNRWINSVAEPEIDARRKMDKGVIFDAKIISLLNRKAEKEIMDSLRVTSAKFINVEEKILEGHIKASNASASHAVFLTILVSLLSILIGIVAIFFISRSIFRKVGGEPGVIAAITEQIAKGNLEVGLEKWNGAETGILASVKSMLEALKINKAEVERNDWFRIGRGDLNDQIRGVLTVEELCQNIITFLC